MTIKTFDPNRVGGGTFQLEQDSTGAYTIKEVGFVKLPDLKLPEIDQAAYTPPDTDDDTTPDPCPPGFKLVDGVCQRIQTSDGGGGGGGQDQTFTDFDYTGTKEYQNIQKDATGGNTLMESAQKFSGQDTGIKVENIGNDPEQNSALISYNQALKVYNDAVAKTDTSNPNEMKNVDEAKALVDKNREFYEKSVAPGGLFFEGTMKDAPIADFSQGPRTVPTGTLTGAKVEDIGKTFRSDTDKFKTRFDPTKIEPAEVKPSFMESAVEGAKKILDPRNSVVVKIASGVAKGLKTFEDALLGPQQVALNKSNKDALTSLGYKTRGELGSNVDSQRIAGNPATNVFAGMNRTSATGNVMAGARKRVSTIQRTIDRAKAKGDTAKAERFEARKKEFNKQIEEVQAKKNKADLATGGVAPGASGGGGGSGGCFLKGTLITMLDGTTKTVEQVDLGDKVAVGGKVFAVGRFLNTELYDYKGIKVSGSHMVNEDGVWVRVRDTKHGKSLGDDLNTVYVFGSENRRILINNILFTDYFEVSEQDQLINNEKDFFNNWKSYENTIDEHNVNTLNAS